MTRQEANKRILEILIEEVNGQPDIRFGQLLRNLGAISEEREVDGPMLWANEFYLEPQDLLQRIEKTRKMINEFSFQGRVIC